MPILDKCELMRWCNFVKIQKHLQIFDSHYYISISVFVLATHMVHVGNFLELGMILLLDLGLISN